MQATQNWYDLDRVRSTDSRVLAKFMREQDSARSNKSPVVQNATDSVVIKSGDPQVLHIFGIKDSKIAITPQSAQRTSALGACIGLIGDAMSTLPCHHYKRENDEVKKRIHGSLISRLLNLSPDPSWTSAAMYQWWVRCKILRGDGITEIIRDRKGEPIALLPWHPDRVDWKKMGNQLIYRFSPADGSKPYNRLSDDVLHMIGNGFDGERSLSAIQYDAYDSLGIALAANSYSKKFFENGASPKHLFSTEKEMNKDQIDQFRELYDTRYAGPHNAGRPMVLTEGLTVSQLSMSSVDAQMLETLKYSVIDIARACRVPPALIGAQDTSSSWGTGIYEMKQGFVAFHLEPMANLWEQEINRKLIRRDDEYVEFNFKGFLRGDAKSEGEALRQARGGSQGPGWLTLDEVRRVDNLPPVGPENGGNVIYEPKGKSDEKQNSTTD